MILLKLKPRLVNELIIKSSIKISRRFTGAKKTDKIGTFAKNAEELIIPKLPSTIFKPPGVSSSTRPNTAVQSEREPYKSKSPDKHTYPMKLIQNHEGIQKHETKLLQTPDQKPHKEQYSAKIMEAARAPVHSISSINNNSLFTPANTTPSSKILEEARKPVQVPSWPTNASLQQTAVNPPEIAFEYLIKKINENKK